MSVVAARDAVADVLHLGAYAPIDPLAVDADGAYRDELVDVRTTGPDLPRLRLHTIRTPHFDVRTSGRVLEVLHRVPPEQVDDDLAGTVAQELFAAGWLRGSELFERIFTGVVVTSGATPLEAWENFYRNTLRRIDEAIARPEGVPSGGHGTIADYAPVYAHAESLLVGGSALELGSCFGFLALRVARDGRRTTASDVTSGTMRLLGAMAPRLGIGLVARMGDAGRFSGPDDSADTVLAVHLLEHIDVDHGERVLAEAVRLARRRVVVAVPLEDEADVTWGHVRTVSLADLDAMGRRTGRPYEVHEHHGGWLVVETD